MVLVVALDSPGPTAKQNRLIESVRPGGGDGPGLSTCLSATDWQSNTTTPGFVFPLSEIGGTLNFAKLARGIVPAGYLAQGGRLELHMTGEFTPGSSEPTIAIKATLGGTLLRPRQPITGIDSGLSGWILNIATLGLHSLEHFSANTRWTLDVSIRSLGRYSAASGSFPAGSATILCEGYFRIGSLSYPGGEPPGLLHMPLGGSGVHDLFLVGRSYTRNDIVQHLNQVWFTWVSHTGVATAEPGGPVPGGPAPLPAWREYWMPLVIESRVNQTNVVDLADFGTGLLHEPLVFEVEVGGPQVDDTTDPAAWAIGHGTYNDNHPAGTGDQVTNGGDRWSCIKTHTSDAANEPGVGADNERSWVEITGQDSAICDSIELYAMGGVAGRVPFQV